jgi:hypothetical protein
MQAARKKYCVRPFSDNYSNPFQNLVLPPDTFSLRIFQNFFELLLVICYALIKLARYHSQGPLNNKPRVNARGRVEIVLNSSA